MFTNDKKVFVILSNDFGINQYRVVITTHQNLLLGKCRKLFQASLSTQATTLWEMRGASFEGLVALWG